MKEEEIKIDTNHVMLLMMSSEYRLALAYVVKKFYEAMGIGLTEKGAMAITNYLFDMMIKEEPEIKEKEICSEFILLAIQDQGEFIKIIKGALIEVGMELMKEK